MADIQAIYEMFGCRMNNAELAREALTLAGALGARAEGNKRLAMLGDKSIGVTVLKGWYECGTPCERGSRLLDAAISNENLARIGHDLGLDGRIHKNPSQRGTASWKTMAMTVEAIFGAIWQEQGPAAVRNAMISVGLLET